MSQTETARELIRTVLRDSVRPCVTSSFQADCVALVRLVNEEAPGIPVLFLDTGYHFAATYAYRDEIVKRLGLNLVNVAARRSVAEQEAEFGKLYAASPDRCCGLRKVEPLFAALEGYDTWFTALRREQSPTRANLREIEAFRLPTGTELKKVSPLAAWTWPEVWREVKAAGLPVLSLYDQGYTSIGCEPCTAKPEAGEDARSGRWGGKKLECGIHIQPGASHA